METATLPEAHKTGGLIGAEIRGLDLTREYPDETYEAVRQAWAEHGVIFFRDQHLNEEQRERFATKLGTIRVKQELRKEPEQTRAIGEGWHTDMTCFDEPPVATMLFAEEIPWSAPASLEGGARADERSRVRVIPGRVKRSASATVTGSTTGDGDSSGNACWSASAIASSPAAFGCSGAGSAGPCTHGSAVHSSCPANRGAATPNPNRSGALRQHLVQLPEPGEQHLHLGRGHPVLLQAADDRPERRVVLVHQHRRVPGQPVQVAEQLVVVPGEVLSSWVK